MSRLVDTRTLRLIPRRQSNGKATRLLPPHFNRLKNTRSSVSIWRRTRVRQNTRLCSISKTGEFGEAKTGRGRIIGLSGITDLRGTTEAGGRVITTESFSHMVDGTTGIQAGGTPHGDTLPMRITLTMVRFMP